MVWPKYVFPSIRIFIWFVIAVALVKIAFGSVGTTASGEEGEEFPSSEFSGGVHVVDLATITSQLELPTTVVMDPSVDVKAGAVGTVGYWAVADGEKVFKGQALLDIHVPIMSKKTVDADGNVVEPHDTGLFTRHTIEAPIDGTVKRSIDLKEETTKTTAVFSIVPGTLSIEGSLTPQQQFQILELPKTAKVSLAGGPEPFVCEGLTIGTDLVSVADTPDDSGEGFDGIDEEPPGQTVGVKVKCIAPTDIRLIAGLDGTMSILAGEVKDAVVVPITAIQTVKDAGKVWVIDEATGEETERELVLGLSQGQLIEVKKGLEPGETVRQYAPGNMEEMPFEESMMGF
ncbi:hypothetical protein V5R04_01195 [Jonesiaceae bacterium BS-20]|uniref:Multidrug resistance protein MdtA-like C-terminal permuted SH3 domain-containing protein n=1 Tax=Jonesiaceae bacterium BS-20 TaxID=3120821 RepID=A0AAU7DXW9_9MICO